MSDKTWELHTRHGLVKAQLVVNAGGLYGDRVENICRPSKFTYDINFVHLLLSDLNALIFSNEAVVNIFRINPGKGEAVLYPKAARKLVNHMILQIPSARSKGIIIYPTGNKRYLLHEHACTACM